MFGDFELFSDPATAEKYRVVLLQTPTSKLELEVRCVEVIVGWETTNCTSFDNSEEFRFWYEERLVDSDVVLGNEKISDSVTTFCTCSYSYWSNERTLVLASPSS